MTRIKQARRTNLAFSIRTDYDFFEKLEQELRALKAEPWSSRHAINFAMNAWHLKEWIWALRLKGSDAEQQRLFGQRVNAKEYGSEVLRKCPDLDIMRQICNGSKHLGTDEPSITDTFMAAPIDVKAGEDVEVTLGDAEVRFSVGTRTERFIDSAERVVYYWGQLLERGAAPLE